MNDLILHRVQQGLTRLLSLPRDLDEAWPRSHQPIHLSAASEAHRKLFQEYDKELDENVKIALDWWKGRLNVKQHREKLDRKEALRAMYSETIAGPVSPEIIWVVRKYWFECEKLNKSLPTSQWIPPEVFLLTWLMDCEREQALDVLSGMIYWPIGLDEDGNWV